MKIVADKDLHDCVELLSHFGELTLLPGREIRNNHLVDADALVVRSATCVSKELIKGTSLKFIGSATSGTDHINLDYLSAKNITFADAKGSNANAVTDYCLAAISEFWGEKGFNQLKLNVGIIGNGMIGSRLAVKIGSLGWNVLINDQPQSDLKLKGKNKVSYHSLDEIAQCDIVSVHVPLTLSGSYATKNLLGKEFLLALPRNAMLINTSRGGVIDEDVLIEIVRQREDLTVVNDVWSNEPDCNMMLARMAAIATPHIAGYSARAKANGMLQILRALSEFSGLDLEATGVLGSKADAYRKLSHVKDRTDAIRRVFPIIDISSRFKKSVAEGKHINGKDSFDSMRKSLVRREEFCEYAIPERVSEDEVRFLSAAGFQN